MASGSHVVQWQGPWVQTRQVAAQRGLILGTDTAVTNFETWDFDGTTIEYIQRLAVMNSLYAGGGLTWSIQWSPASDVVNTVRFGVAVRRLDTAEDLDTTAHSWSYQEATGTPPAAVGQSSVTAVTMTSGAQMDSWAANELALIRIRRETTDAADTATASNLRLWAMWGRET